MEAFFFVPDSVFDFLTKLIQCFLISWISWQVTQMTGQEFMVLSIGQFDVIVMTV